MGITLPPKKPVAPASRQVDEAALARIVAAAPDATPAEKKAAPHGRKMAGNQAQISFALPVELLDKVDEAASALSISRAAFIKQALTRAVQTEIFRNQS